MQAEVLIAYVSRSGSTEDVAEAMGVTMEDAGVTVDVKPMANVESIADDAAVVIGAALYVGHFPREFRIVCDALSAGTGECASVDFCSGTDGERTEAFCCRQRSRRARNWRSIRGFMRRMCA